MAEGKTSYFRVPASTVVETIYVQLDDGRLVPRSPEELAELPDELVPAVQIPAQT